MKPDTKIQNPVDEAKQAEKDTKKQLESYYEVTKHKLGRAPTADEVMETMTNREQNASSHPSPEKVLMPNEEEPELGEDSPKILRTKVFYGMNGEGEERTPDENKVLFYESPDGLVFDINSQEWMSDRPEVVNHLPHRDLRFEDRDIISAIMHGVMDDEDYDALDSRGMISETPKKLWDLAKQLKEQTDQLEMIKSESDDDITEDLEKSEDITEEDVEVTSDFDTDFNDEVLVEDSQDSGIRELPQEIGTDLIAEIVRSAMSDALAGPGLEAAIRNIVREELSGVQDKAEETISD